MKNLYSLRTYLSRAVLLLSLALVTGTVHSQELMRSNLYVVPTNGTAPVLMDGSLTIYNDAYSNDVDWDDATKMSNFGENFGIIRAGKTLVIERRRIITDTDTTVFKMWNLQQTRTYQIEIIAQSLNHPDLFAFVKDEYLNNSTPVNLNGTTTLNFNINSDPASKSQTRFKIIYNSIFAPAPAAFSFTGVELGRTNNSFRFQWKVANDFAIEKYIVEKSDDGKNFTAVSTITKETNTLKDEFVFTDNKDFKKENHFRVKAVGYNSAEFYSEVAKLDAMVEKTTVNIYPNPVVNKQMNLAIAAEMAGTYQVVLLHNNGVQQSLGKLSVAAGKNQKMLALPSGTAAGIYRIKIIAPDLSIQTKTITVL